MMIIMECGELWHLINTRWTFRSPNIEYDPLAMTNILTQLMIQTIQVFQFHV